MSKKAVLMILDGWGIGDKAKDDVISQTPTPYWDSLNAQYPHSELQASGENVGLPDGQMGNSEVGHLSIGAGRVVYQDLVKINIACRNNSILQNPEKVAVTPPSSTVDMIDQSLYFVEKNDKKPLLIELLKNKDITSALVFSRTKHGADKIARFLVQAGISADAIHGEKSQNARQRALNNFKDHKIKVLVATDIAARGIDIDELSHVFNNDLPEVPETYVHRIGRTGRAGNNGTAISFCSSDEMQQLKDIQKLIGKQIPVIENHNYVSDLATIAQYQAKAKVAEKEKAKKKWTGNKGNGDYWRRQKRQN